MRCLNKRAGAGQGAVVLMVAACLAGPVRGQEAPAFDAGVPLGTVTSSAISEASGLAASRRNPGVVWVHNDGAARLYALSTNAQLLATWRVANAGDGDYEDVAIGPGPDPRISYLYFGDIGNNNLTTQEFRLFRIPEPAVYPYLAANPPTEPLPTATLLRFNYPDFTREAEALMVDPRTGDVLIATKAKGVSEVFRATQAQLASGGTVTLEPVATVGFNSAAGADISPAGDLIALRQEDAALMWPRGTNQPVAEALAGFGFPTPVIGRPTEPNGEAIGFAADGSGYFTISEGVNPVLYFFPRLDRTDFGDGWSHLVPPGATWRYLDNGSDAGTAWREAAFVDSAWKLGPAQLGYGDDDQATTINSGSSSNKRVTSYFRTEFTVTNAASVVALKVRVVFDDGVAVYLNGSELVREHLAVGAGFATPATASNSDLENIWLEYPVPAAALREGRNVLAAEVHRFDPGEADLSFDLQLLGRVVVIPELRASLTADGAAVRLEVSGAAGESVVIEGSTDFGAWSAVGTVTLVNGVGSLEVPLAGNAVRCFRTAP